MLRSSVLPAWAAAASADIAISRAVNAPPVTAMAATRPAAVAVPVARAAAANGSGGYRPQRGAEARGGKGGGGGGKRRSGGASAAR